MKAKNLVELSEATSHHVGYNEDAKKEFIRLGKRFIKDLMQSLQSQGISNMESSYNKAGIAVSGEFTLKGLYENEKGGFYIQLTFSSSRDFGFYRATAGLKDYSGGRNHMIQETNILNGEELVSRILSDSMREEADGLFSGKN
jgi:hypothetical protein